jgi:hypothetical protein
MQSAFPYRKAVEQKLEFIYYGDEFGRRPRLITKLKPN